MGWPESDDSQYLWRDGGEPARGVYANVAKAISQFEPLYMAANPGEAAANARKVFEDSPNVTVVEVPINDGWTRDWGPSVSISLIMHLRSATIQKLQKSTGSAPRHHCLSTHASIINGANLGYTVLGGQMFQIITVLSASFNYTPKMVQSLVKFMCKLRSK